jgi:competence protein ComGC
MILDREEGFEEVIETQIELDYKINQNSQHSSIENLSNSDIEGS